MRKLISFVLVLIFVSFTPLFAEWTLVNSVAVGSTNGAGNTSSSIDTTEEAADLNRYVSLTHWQGFPERVDTPT